MRVTAVVSLDIGVDSPVLCRLDLSDDKGVGVGVSLDVTKEPGWKGFRDVVAVDTRGRVEILNEDGVFGSSSGAHDSALVNIFDIAGLHGESINDDGEVRYLSTIFFESFWTFDCISEFIRTQAVLEVFDGSLTSCSDGVEIDVVFGFLRCESFRKSTIPSCLGCGQCLVDAFLGVIALLSKSGDEGFVSIFVVDGMAQFPDSRASNVLGQGSNCLGGESVLPVVNEGEGALGVDDRDFGELQDLG